MLTAPSLTTDYALVYSGDPALDCPEPLDEGASDESKTAHAEREKDWAQRLENARDTGRWDGMYKPGQRPTLFRMRQVPGSLRRRLLDLFAGPMSDRPAEFTALCFRAAIVSVENLGEKVEIKRAHDPATGAQIATTAIVDQLDAIHLGIVGELGDQVFTRVMRASPKH